jgi:hypothetical protein
MSGFRSALLLGTIAVATTSGSLPAQDPCGTKKAFDAADPAHVKARRELDDFQVKHHLPLKPPSGNQDELKAALDAATAKARTAAQLTQAADQSFKDADKAAAEFKSDPNKAIRLANLIKAKQDHDNKVAQKRKEKKDRKADIDALEKLQATVNQREEAIKKKLTGADLISPITGADLISPIPDVRSAIDVAVAPFAAAAAEVSRGGHYTGPTTTKLKCANVSSAAATLKARNDSRPGLVSDQEHEQNPQEKQKLKDQIVALDREIAQLQDQFPAEVVKCEAELRSDLAQLESDRTNRDKKDPDKSLSRLPEELKMLEAQTTDETTLAELQAESKRIDEELVRARDVLKQNHTAQEAADLAVEEATKALAFRAADDALAPIATVHSIVVKDLNERLNGADAEVQAAQALVKDMDELDRLTAEHDGLKAQFDRDAREYVRRRDAYKAGSPPHNAAEKMWLDAEKTRLLPGLQRVKDAREARDRFTSARGLDPAALCRRKGELRVKLGERKERLKDYGCYDNARDVLTQIDQLLPRVKLDLPKPGRSGSLFQAASWTSMRRAPHVRHSRIRTRAQLIRALDCTTSTVVLEPNLEDIERDLRTPTAGATSAEPTDEVPSDVGKGTGEVKVPRYGVYLLTSASGGLWVGDEDEIKTRANCSFVGGGVGCKPTDYVKYKRLLGPFPTQEEAQQALCGAITATRIFPFGIGLKGQWQGSNTWYGLWDAGVNGCKKP